MTPSAADEMSVMSSLVRNQASSFGRSQADKSQRRRVVVHSQDQMYDLHVRFSGLGSLDSSSGTLARLPAESDLAFVSDILLAVKIPYACFRRSTYTSASVTCILYLSGIAEKFSIPPSRAMDY